jgi:hypothetical protein
MGHGAFCPQLTLELDEAGLTSTQNKSLSDAFDPVLSLQGIGWLTRKAIGAATVTQHLKQGVAEDGVSVRIDVTQLVSGGVKGNSEDHRMNWEFGEHSDWLFGSVKGRSRYTTLANILEESKGQGVTEEDAKYLAQGWLKETEEGEVVQCFVENESSKWTAVQVWGFAEINGVRMLTRRFAVRKTNKDEVVRVRLVYDWAGELK